MKKKLKILMICILCVIISLGGAFGAYVSSGYKAQCEVFIGDESCIITDSKIKITRLKSGNIEFAPEEIKAGLIFYPGGNVEYTAYAPLLEKIAEKGILCVLVKMPFNLAVFDVNAGEGIAQEYPDIDKWYIVGHSLGGAMAGTYASSHHNELDGLILLAGYSSTDISGLDIDALSIYGSDDGVMNRENYDKYKTNLPDDFTEIVIDGGCHSYFGDYSMQKGDGNPQITRQEQMSLTAEYISQFTER